MPARYVFHFTPATAYKPITTAVSSKTNPLLLKEYSCLYCFIVIITRYHHLMVFCSLGVFMRSNVIFFSMAAASIIGITSNL